MKVLIIGGGLGGLCLANGLHNNGIEVRLFERHTSVHGDKQGYFIHLEGQGQRALQHCLNKQGWDAFLATSTPTGAQWAFRDPNLDLIAMRDDVAITGKPLESIERRAIERWELRSVLFNALGPAVKEVVQWDRTFTHYEDIGNGKVRAFFADGSTEDGDVLVGADGSKSKVCRQRFPLMQREDLGIVAVCGQYPLNDKNSQELPELMTNSSLNNIVPYGNGWMFLSSWHSRRAQPNGLDRSSGYTLWAYFIPKNNTLANVTKMDAEELREVVLAGVRGWDPLISHVVQDADAATIAPVYMRCAPNLDHWDPTNVTLLGDAIHSMTPAAGVGANTALKDAKLLTELLVQAANGKLSIIEAIGKYEETMRPYANAAVALSRQIAEGAASSSLAERFMFRMVLKLAQASPWVMRATIGRGALETCKDVGF